MIPSGISLIGVSVLNVVVKLETLDINDSDWIKADKSIISPGGIIVPAIGCSRLGIETDLITTTCQDGFFNLFENTYIREYIRPICLGRTKRWPVVTSLIDAQGGFCRIVDFDYPLDIAYEKLDPNLGANRLLFVEGYAFLEIAEQYMFGILTNCRIRGQRLVFDPQSAIRRLSKAHLQLILRQTALLTLNAEELAILLAVLDLTESKTLLTYGIDRIYVKLGKDGCEVIQSNQTIHIEPFWTSVYNLQGAGDAFNSALILGELSGYTAVDIGVMANANGALKIRSVEIAEGMPRVEQLQSYLFDCGIHTHPLVTNGGSLGIS